MCSEKYEDLDIEEKEDLILQEGRERHIYYRINKTINLSRFRTTDSKQNAHITLPDPYPLIRKL